MTNWCIHSISLSTTYPQKKFVNYYTELVNRFQYHFYNMIFEKKTTVKFLRKINYKIVAERALEIQRLIHSCYSNLLISIIN
jgi:hypothetical protein